MPVMQPINLRSFKQKARHAKRKMRRFLTKLENDAPRGLDKKIVGHEKEVWAETDCLSCANCCKTMTPTFTIIEQRSAPLWNVAIETERCRQLTN
jgi:hypothetical protein